MVFSKGNTDLKAESLLSMGLIPNESFKGFWSDGFW